MSNSEIPDLTKQSFEVTVLECMLGDTIVSTDKYQDDWDNSVLELISETNIYKFHHVPDYSEVVWIEDICGELADLIGQPLTMAESVRYDSIEENDLSSETWTFYKFATTKGAVTVRWCGSSNGYYCEEVDFTVIPRKIEVEGGKND